MKSMENLGLSQLDKLLVNVSRTRVVLCMCSVTNPESLTSVLTFFPRNLCSKLPVTSTNLSDLDPEGHSESKVTQVKVPKTAISWLLGQIHVLIHTIQQ